MNALTEGFPLSRGQSGAAPQRDETPWRANSADTERYKNAARAKSFRHVSPIEQLVALFATTGLKTCSCRLAQARNQRE